MFDYTTLGDYMRRYALTYQIDRYTTYPMRIWAKTQEEAIEIGATKLKNAGWTQYDCIDIKLSMGK